MSQMFPNSEVSSKPGDTFTHDIIGNLIALSNNSEGSSCRGCIGSENRGHLCRELPNCACVVWVRDNEKNRLKAITDKLREQ